MLKGKQRSYLKGLANKMKPIAQIGKNGITESFISQLDDMLESKELIKVNILETSLLDAKEAANELARLTNSEFVQAIGNKFVLYREAKEEPTIELPR
ncbi:MAG: ribosome assembly RNA-binding protein YhbY [Anaeromicrobium sp.]|jgi:RNA-binding protein|uniref:ribosome assembly RNA-binding protein YhbY n=1 Tax=Anaeromicrobium sp. TaxID=1929132 RepID=UPI0025D80977|nr:ribosome assembly RNA-binding protein YhbY [Anaeromicrobium sp.]MCT4594859.1 ribosome assembly RNA-binding protein YhbY [Anaeromicrobium sp.]